MCQNKMNCVDVTNYAFKPFVLVRFLGFVLVSFMLVYVNSLFYSLAVIGVSRRVIFFVVINAKISILVFIFFVIVYVGAIIIFIGYICAVRPNFVVSSGYSFLVVLLLVVVGRGLSMLSIDQTQVFSKNIVLVEYFYSM